MISTNASMTVRPLAQLAMYPGIQKHVSVSVMLLLHYAHLITERKFGTNIQFVAAHVRMQ